MNDLHSELLRIADRLDIWSERAALPDVKDPLDALESAANMIGKAWSGSWLGYHACVYYENLESPPPGAHFSSEWGFNNTPLHRETTGKWREFRREHIEKTIHDIAGNPDLGDARDIALNARSDLKSDKVDLLSILTTSLSERQDTFIVESKRKVEQIESLTEQQILASWRPSGQVMTRDSLAASQGLRVPPHFLILSKIHFIWEALLTCGRLAQIARKTGSHLSRQQKMSRRSEEVGTNIFIGHGRSSQWREVKDFIEERLHLPWDEFNRTPVAGVTNTARLSEMLDSAVFALLVMTGEDEQSDGTIHARMNVVHEAGLFQGRLGFTRAVILLEEGCEEFSNIEGLGQIRFPQGRIKATFEEIRLVLERENILEAE